MTADNLAHAIAAAYTCPDCSADVELVPDDHGVHHLLVRHDDTCPAYLEVTR